MTALLVEDTLNTFLQERLSAICLTESLPLELNFYSNVAPDNDNQKLRVYIRSRIARESQDTLAVDVVDFGRIRYTSVGVYALSFFMPRNVSGGYLKMATVAQTLKTELRQKRFECTWLRNVTATPYQMENNSYRYELTFSFEFDEIV